MIGRGDGKGVCILAEQFAPGEQLREWVEPTHYRDRTEAGFQTALPLPVRGVRPNSRTAQQLNDESNCGSSGTSSNW